MNHLESLPWSVKQFQSGFVVADSEGWQIGEWESLEFARFIAAVPDLLAALEALFTVIANVDTVYESETGRTIEQDFAEELDKAREILR